MPARAAGLRARFRRNRGDVVFLAATYVGCVVLLVVLGESWVAALPLSLGGIGLVLLRDLLYRRDVAPPEQPSPPERAQLFRQPRTDALADKVAPLTDTETVVQWVRNLSADAELFIDRSWGTVCVSRREAGFEALLSDGDQSWFATSLHAAGDEALDLAEAERLVIAALQSDDKPTTNLWRPLT